MKQADIKFTYQDYLLLTDDKRYEILEGELYVVPSPNTYHQRISLRLAFALYEHVRQENLGEVFAAPYDILLSEVNVVQPDILFISKEHAGIIGENNTTGAPDLVVEILSEGTKSKDLRIKRKVYGKYGVLEYWIVDPEAKAIEVLTRSKTGYMSAGLFPSTSILSSPLFPDLRLNLAEIF
jgi:Uma2 family endonuclease